jgi:hypothetical protein
MEHNDKDFISYLIGFTEAEGSFSVTKKNNTFINWQILIII